MLRLTARAKINWTLDILGTRADGYHLMDMLMQSVALCDTLEMEESDALCLERMGGGGEARERVDALTADGVSYDERNLVYRAAKALCAHTGCERGARIRLQKRIPSGAGMGGGSADAAAALKGLNELWGLGLSPDALSAIGLTLGADIPFMLQGGLARVGGIGERIVPLRPAPRVWLTLTQPCDGLNTGEIFNAFDAGAAAQGERPRTEEAQAALLAGDLPALGRAMGNVMEAVCARMRPAIAQAARELEQLGALRAMMTGSGSVVYGVFTRREDALEAYQTLRARGKPSLFTRTETDGGRGR